MKKLLFLIFVCLLDSCRLGNDNAILKSDIPKDSALVYFNEAKDKTISLTSRKKAIDRSFLLLENRSGDTLIPYALYQKNLIHFSAGEYDSLRVYNDLLIDYASQANNDAILADQYYLMGYYFAEVMHVDNKAVQYYTRSKEHFERVNDSNGVAKNLLNIGNIQKNQNDFFGSKETLVEALRYFDDRKDGKLIAHCYNALATDHRKLLNYSDAITYYNKAIEISDSERDVLNYKNNLATVYVDDKRYDEAISLWKGIVKDSLLIENKKEYARVLDNLAYANWLSGQEVGVENFQVPLNLRLRNNDRRGQIASYTHLGEFYSKSNPSKAKVYFDAVIQLSKTQKIPRAEKDVLKFLMQLEPQNVKLRNRYIFLQDSLYEQELKVKTQFAKYKYDDEVKRASILRLEKENAEKELETSRQRSEKIMYLGGILFLVTVLGLAFYSFKQRTKRLKQAHKLARLEAVQETEAELSRRIHDDHGARLNKTMVMVQNDADKSLVLDSLEILYNRSRDFSREINEVDVGPNFWEEFLSMLTFRTPSDTKLFVSGGKEIDWSSVAEPTKIVLFKVLQELMINMGRHSKAKIVAITFQLLDKRLKVNYEDDGVGTTKKQLLLKNGLRNTEKRIRAIDGSIIFDSEKNSGFRAEIQIPK